MYLEPTRIRFHPSLQHMGAVVMSKYARLLHEHEFNPCLLQSVDRQVGLPISNMVTPLHTFSAISWRDLSKKMVKASSQYHSVDWCGTVVSALHQQWGWRSLAAGHQHRSEMYLQSAPVCYLHLRILCLVFHHLSCCAAFMNFTSYDGVFVMF